MASPQFMSEFASTSLPDMAGLIGRYVKEACALDPKTAADTISAAAIEAVEAADGDEWELLSIDDLLDKADALGGLEWLVPNFLVKGGIHFLTAPASGGKSWLMLDLCIKLAAGDPWLGHMIEQPSPILYIDEEMGDMQARGRVKKLEAARGTPFFYLGKQGFSLFDSDCRRKVCEIIKAKNIKLLVIDTLTGVAPGFKENESEHASKLRSFLKEFTKLGCTVIVAHHDRKGGQGDAISAHERMAGSRDLAAQGDMCYGLEIKGEIYHLLTIKNRHLSPDDAPTFDYVLDDDEEKTTVTIRLIGDDERLGKMAAKHREQMQERILQALATTGTMNTRELCTAVKGSPNAVLQAAKELTDANKIERVKAGREFIFSLPSLQEEGETEDI